MTNSHLQRLEQLRSSADINLDTDLSRDRRRLIADSFKFLGFAWEMDAETHLNLTKLGSVATGEIVELYVSGTVSDIPGLDQRTETAVEITFASMGRTERVRKLVVGFFIPKELDHNDPHAMDAISDREGIFVTQRTDDDLPIRYWITEFTSQPFIVPDADGGNDPGNYSALDYEGPDSEEIVRAREAAIIANLRESIVTWDLIPSKTIRKTEDGFEAVAIPS